MHALPIYVRLKGRPVILLGDGEAADAKRRLLERAGATIVGESDPAILAIVAIAEDASAKAAIARLQARGILVNAVDRPTLCDFTLPAIVDRDPLLVAIGTGGASAGLAKAMRQRLERLIPAGLGQLAESLKVQRSAIREKWPEARDRRRAIDAALDEGGPIDPFADPAADTVARWIAAPSPAVTGTADRLETLILRSDDPHDLTIAQTLLLGQADRLYLAPGVPDAIGNRARADAARIEAETPPAEPGPGLSIFVCRVTD
jgi:uroporphyrin-III C-methyltransferase/precorrin-2 dehydrogenase/sirohydrochlorin ferrochelatase